MPKPSKNKRQMLRDEERRRLHDAVDRIVDGPAGDSVDEWVVQVLADIGSVFRAAAPALDYEVGRVISGVDRPLGHFPSHFPSNSWQGASICVGPQQANAWIAAGEAARSDRPSPTTHQRALAAWFRPIASLSCHSWLQNLADALDALRFGEVHEIISPSPSGLHGYKHARTVWMTRLHALAWAEFQFRAKLMKKTEAEWEVVSACGLRDPGSIADWKRRTKELFGRAVVQENLEWAAAMGRRYRSIQDQLFSGRIEKSEVTHEIGYLDRVFGRGQLEDIAQTYKAQARKSAKK
jgi:hypothetical protein